jgi:hypothetical protein
MNLLDFKSIIILFPAGYGGNHIANLLSLSDKIENRCHAADYCSLLKSEYSNSAHTRVHIGSKYAKVRNLSALGVTYEPMVQLLKDSALPVMLLAHSIDLKTVNQFLKLGQIGVITIIPDDNGRLLEARVEDSFLNMKYQWQALQTQLPEYVTKITEVRATEWLVPDIRQTLSRLNTDLKLDLPLDVCNELHAIWYSRFFNAQVLTHSA